MPLAAVRTGHVPHGTSPWTAVDPDVDPQVPGAVSVAAVQEVAELDAVCVVLAERPQQQVPALPRGMLGGVDHHEGPWGRERRELFSIRLFFHQLASWKAIR